MKILVTGFDPFDKEPINPAIEVVKRLPDQIKGADILKLEVPTVRYESIELIDQTIEKENPDVILSIGQAGGRAEISVERIGINVDDFRIKDNHGNQPIDEVIFKDGQSAYFSSLPIKAMVERIKSANIPASVSNSAGTFVCNHVLYGVAHLIITKYPKKKSGFIHIPFMNEQVVNKENMPSMDIETMTLAIEKAIEAIVNNPNEDIRIEGGKLD